MFITSYAVPDQGGTEPVPYKQRGA